MSAVDGIATISELAARDGLSRAAVSKFIRDHAEAIATARDARQRVTGVSVASYDAARARLRDGAMARVQPSAAAAPPPSGNTLDDARIAKLDVDTRLARINLEFEAGRLLRVDALQDGLDRLAEELARVLDLSGYADKIALAAQKGRPALLAELKNVTFQQRTRAADACAGLAMSAPRREALISETEEAAGQF